MNLIKWQPFNPLSALTSELERARFGQEWQLPQMALDVLETEEAIIVKATVPGAKKEDYTITAEGKHLTLKARVAEDEEVQGAHYHIRERVFGEVSRNLRFPFPLNTENAEAGFENGVLRIQIPKAPQARKKTIQVS